ncbi:MAG: FtsQ-type POTRA domain-containing protein [Gammaproteobacteria bacterium]|nr:FtsQ-type POTRA domain-containing protein [Gammaproteobacteria bacterium]
MKRKFLWVSLSFVLVGAMGWMFLSGKLPVFFPVAEISIRGEYRYLNTEELKTIIHPYVKKGFLFVDLEALKSALMGVPWIKRVSVKRRGIDRLEIKVLEHTVIGRWEVGWTKRALFASGPPISERGLLLTENGLVLKPVNSDIPLSVPVFSGELKQASWISQKYPTLLWILAPIKMTLTRLYVTERGAWEIELENGLVLLLGQRKVDERLRRFVSLFEGVGTSLLQNVKQVDLRYANGIAVKQKM